MDNLFLGLLFVLLDFNINFDQCSIGLIPDWLGYWFLAKGLVELEGEWEGFRKGHPVALGMMVYSGILYVLDLFAVTAQLGFLSWVLGLISTIAFLYILRQIARGICYMEDTHLWDLQGQKLDSLWLALAVIHVTAALLAWFPVVGVVCALAALVISICYLVALNGTKKRYHEYVG